jgi:LPS sulfotransferase NodH
VSKCEACPLPGSPLEKAMAHGRLLLVLSPERSGSTLLSTMLGAHSGVIAPPELFLLRYADFDSWRLGKDEALASFRWLLARRGEPAAEPRAVYERFRGWSTLDLYRWMLRRFGPKRILVDKTPAYGRDAAALSRAEQLTPLYLWLMRHPLGVANSWVERRRARRWRGIELLRGAASTLCTASPPLVASRLKAHLDDRAAVDAAFARWCTVHETVADFLDRIPADRVFRVAYEDIVASTRSSLTALCDWLGIAFEEAMLEPWNHLPDALDRGLGDELIRSHRRIESSRAHSWRNFLDETRLDARTRSLMARLATARGEPTGDSYHSPG